MIDSLLFFQHLKVVCQSFCPPAWSTDHDLHFVCVFFPYMGHMGKELKAEEINTELNRRWLMCLMKSVTDIAGICQDVGSIGISRNLYHLNSFISTDKHFKDKCFNVPTP